jgi:type I restriction enzyme S subunit
VNQVAPWLADSHWPTVPIRYLARLGTGHTPSRQHPEYWENCDTPWMTLADVWQLRSGTVDYVHETKDMISKLGLANSAAVLHPAGTVILSRTASVGFSGIMGRDMATSQDFATWTCGERLHPKYLLYVLRAMAPDLRRVAAGSTHKTIYMPEIEGLRTPIPPVDEQQRIADFLDAEVARIDRLREAKQRQITLLGERAETVFSGKVGELLGTYGSIPMRRLWQGIEQGWSPQCEDAEADPDEWAVLRTSAVSSGTFDPLAHKRMPTDIEPDLRYLIRDGDLLLTRGSGSASLVGVAAVAKPEGRRLLLSDLLYRVRLPETWPGALLAPILSSRLVRDQIALLLRGQSGQTIKLRGQDIGEIVVPFVPVESRLMLANELGHLRAAYSVAISKISDSLDLMVERKQALITATVTGQIDVTTARGLD